MHWKQVNVNDEVRVKLTARGRELHRKEHEYLFNPWDGEVPTYRPPVEDIDGWSTWQLWRLMQCFGPRMGNGIPVPFETTMEM